MVPSDRSVWEGIEEQSPKIAPIDLGPLAGVATCFVEENISILIDNALCIFARTDESKKCVIQTRILEGKLSVVFVNIQESSLRSRVH
jgi:hypothetical protein